MAVTYFPFNSIVTNGVPDRPANAESLAAYLAGFFSTGVVMQEDTALKVVASSGMNVQILAGMGNIKGKTIINDAAESITLAAANASLARIDRVVFRLDETNRLMEFDVLTGTPASSPTAPALTRNATVYELCLAEIRVPAGATSIVASYITDTRSNTTLCGTSQTPIPAHMQDIEHGGTNADTAAKARQNINFIGENPITNDTDDTPTKWIELGTGIAHCASPGTSMFIPTEHGILQNIVANNTITQIWTDLADGTPKTWKRSGNASGWFSGWICELQTIKLWENASPSSSFAAQAISMDELMDCEFVIVEFAQKTVLIAYGEYEIVNSIGSASYALPSMATRTVSFSSAGVNFKECYKKGAFNSSTAGTEANDTLIPIAIYGIKGVQ